MVYLLFHLQSHFSSALHQEIFLGDDQVHNSSNTECDECIGLRPYTYPKEERSNKSNSTIAPKISNEVVSEPLPPYDGNLDLNSNYTGFIEIIGEHIKFLVFKNP